jgi:hypothetical protein
LTQKSTQKSLPIAIGKKDASSLLPTHPRLFVGPTLKDLKLKLSNSFIFYENKKGLPSVGKPFLISL